MNLEKLRQMFLAAYNIRQCTHAGCGLVAEFDRQYDILFELFTINFTTNLLQCGGRAVEIHSFETIIEILVDLLNLLFRWYCYLVS